MNMIVCYVGKDLKYFQGLRRRFEEDYPEMEFQFETMTDLDKKKAKNIFIELHELEAKIIYVDFTTDTEDAFSLCKFLNKNNLMRLSSVVGLFNYNEQQPLIEKALNVELRICHYKSMEIHDVVYDPMSFLNVDMAHSDEYTECKEFEKITMLQTIRVGYIEDNFFHVETNSYLNLGDIIELDKHPLIDIMPSKKVFVAKFYDKDLYYTKRFAYDLEFIFIDNDFFSATNDNWLLYKKIKDFPEKMNEIKDVTKEDIIKDMDKRKAAFKPIKEKIENWLKERSHQTVPKKLKVMVVDSTLEFMKNIIQALEEFPYALNVQTKFTADFYQLRRTLPHLIAVCLDEEENNEECLKTLVEKIKTIKDYHPYLLVFNAHELKDLKANAKDLKVITYPHLVSLNELRNMAKLLDDKLHITDALTKVFPSSHSENAKMHVKREIKVLSMTESVVYFQSKVEIPMWTPFIVRQPVQMLLTVIPVLADSEHKNSPKVYRALINGVGMKEKAKLRQLINTAISESED